MDEPFDPRLDFPDVHPAKRLTLAMLRLMICMSIVIAIGLQFAWAKVRLFTPPFDVNLMGNPAALTFIIRPPTYGEWRLWYESGAYGNPVTALISWARFFESSYSLVPGFYFNPRRASYAVSINHFWLIGTSAVLYLVTRWRIRRSARLKTPPS
jgi:hypothetical protein